MRWFFIKILFCLPCAGGLASNYSDLKTKMDNIEIYPIEYKGHGFRYTECYYSSWQEAIIDIYNTINSVCSFENYSILGHSMGALIAYDLYYLILKKKQNLPEELFFAGLMPPNKMVCSPKKGIAYNKMIAGYIKNGGIPKELLRDAKFTKIIRENIINDLKLRGAFVYKRRRPIESKGIILYGSKELSKLIVSNQWKHFFCNPIVLKVIKGNHYFVRNDETIRFLKKYFNNQI